MISAILRAQWLSMSRIGSRRRGTVFSLIAGLIFYGFWTFLAFGAYRFLAERDTRDLFPVVLSTGLMVVFLYWQITPLMSASFGASLDLKKLLVYPVPHDRLFFIEVLLRFTTCAEMLVILLGVLAGLLRNPEYGGWAAIPRLSMALLAFIVFNLLLAAGTRNLLERMLMRRGIKELMMILLVFAGLGPQMIVRARLPRAVIERFLPTALWWPWSAIGHILLKSDVLLAIAFFAVALAIAWWFSRRQFELGLHFDSSPSAARTHARQGRHWVDALFRLPAKFLPDPTAAIVEKELRTFLRIPRFRMVLGMSCLFGLLIYMPMLLKGRQRTFGMTSEMILPVSCVYALLMIGQVTYMNCFGFDRSAAQAWYSIPVSLKQAIVGKNIATAVFFVLQWLLVVLVALLMRAPLTPLKLVEAGAVTLIAGLYWLSAGNISSVHIPRAMDPEKINQMSNRFQALAIWACPLMLLPVALAYWARYVFESDLIFYSLLVFAAILGGVIYWIALDSAVATASKRREKILMELSRGEGPLSA